MKKALPIIGLRGVAGSGKDTLYKVGFAPRLYERISFADPVKGLNATLRTMNLAVSRVVSQFPIGYEHTRNEFMGKYQQELKLAPHYAVAEYMRNFSPNKNADLRKELQQLGTEDVRNKIDPGFWVMHGLYRAWEIIDAGGQVCFTDVRFDDEAWALAGMKEKMQQFYEQCEKNGLPTDPTIRWLLTHTREEYLDVQTHPALLQGLLPTEKQAGVIIRIERHSAGLSGELAQHASERQVAQGFAHEVIDNNGDLLDLQASINELLDYLQGGN